MVSPQCKVTAQKIRSKVAEEHDNCQEFFPCHAVPSLGLAQHTTGIGDHSFRPILAHLGEYRTYSRVAGIGVYQKWLGEIWVGQDWGSSQALS